MSRGIDGMLYGDPDAYIEESLDEDKKTELIVTSLIGFLAFVVFVTSIILAIRIDVRAFTIVAVISALFFTFSLVLVIGFARIHNKKKRTFARMLREIDEREEGLSAEELQRISDETRVRIPRPEVIYRKTKKVKTYKARQIQYSGEIKGKKCPICKLEIDKKDDVLGCPKCLTPFHYDHLFIWLQAKNSCPVCGEVYMIKN